MCLHTDPRSREEGTTVTSVIPSWCSMRVGRVVSFTVHSGSPFDFQCRGGSSLFLGGGGVSWTLSCLCLALWTFGTLLQRRRGRRHQSLLQSMTVSNSFYVRVVYRGSRSLQYTVLSQRKGLFLRVSVIFIFQRVQYFWQTGFEYRLQ